jgi:diguanylate cyclase (GGDEF)-like protein/PAS domain S-box-containing protein
VTSEAAMTDYELRCELAIEAAGMAIWDSSIVNGDIVQGDIRWSEKGAAILGLPPQTERQSFEAFLAMMHEADREETLRTMKQAIDTAGQYQVAYRAFRTDGAMRWLRAHAKVMCDEQGRPDRTLGLIWDVTDRVEQARLASERERMASVTLDSIGDGVITTDQFGATRYINRAGEQLTGWSRQLAVGQNVESVLPLIDESGAQLEHAVFKCLLKQEAVGLSSHTELVTRDGRHIPVEDSAAPIRLDDGELLGAVVVFRDVTHQRALSSQLSWHASHDVLTGLYNRREFEQQVARALQGSKQDDHTHALLFIDLDRFKLVNDTAGHAAGDALLQVLANLLQEKMRESDVLARLGGDEIGVLLTHCRMDQGRIIAEEIRQLIKDFRFVWDGHSFELGASIGMVEISSDSKSVSDLLVAADEACYMAKDEGRNRIHVHSESDAILARRHSEMMWVPRLTAALQNNHFTLHAMPIASLQGPAESHEEVLLRLADNGDEVILPSRFIPAAERYHMMPLVDRWVIHAVCEVIARRNGGANGLGHGQAGGETPSLLSVNLSGPSMSDDTLHQFVTEQFAMHGVDPRRICFEITETAAIGNLPKAQNLMARLKAIGCRFSLDDFGSGLSSFGYLKSLPVDFLKIDGSFIRDIAVNPVHRAMVEAIHKVGQVIGVQTIAEFVEDAATLDVINNIGINFAQGHAVGRERPL